MPALTPATIPTPDPAHSGHGPLTFAVLGSFDRAFLAFGEAFLTTLGAAFFPLTSVATFLTTVAITDPAPSE